MARLYPTFVNFRWSKTLARRNVTCSPTSIPVSYFLFNLHWLPVNKWISFNIATVTYKLQPTYLSTLISYLRSSSPLSFYWPVSSEWTWNEKLDSAVVPCPLQLHKSGIKYLLPLELHHHSTVSNTTLKPIILPFHKIPTQLPTAHILDLSLFLMLVRQQIYYITFMSDW